MKVAIIGAGPAGMTAAYELVKQKVEVEVFEAGSTPGGMAKTIELWDQRVDTGPHRFFSKDKRVNQLWLEVVGNDYEIVDRLTRILYKKKFFSYPLSPINALKNIGVGQAVLCLIFYVKEVLFPTKQDGSFETWVTHRFGKRLYEIFFKSYSEKLWGIPCTELDSDFASQRIKKLSLFEAVKNSIFKSKTKQQRTLLEQFAYPCQGTGMVYQRMADFVVKHGGKIHYKTPVQKINVENQAVSSLELVNGPTCGGFDHIISTMPLSLLVSRLKDIPAPVKDAALALRFRNTILVYLNVDAVDLFPDQWIYIQSPEFKCGRITNFRNWVPQLYGQQKSTILALEYWCNDEDLLWSQTDDAFIRMATDELKLMGFSKGPILGGHVEKIPRCYPVYNKGYKDKIEIIQEYLKTIQGLSVIGRYGSFKYNNQDHSILMGIQAAANILQGPYKDLWKINTDYEDYQESYIITKTGLIKDNE